jgi:hypothetical protein
MDVSHSQLWNGSAVSHIGFDETEHELAQSWEKYASEVAEEWRALLARDPEEKEVQKFLEQHPAMIPGGFNYGPGGNHGPELGGVFREARLKGIARDRRPDFMWVTRSSDLITPICVEIEKPSKRWFTADGIPTADFTQARNQLAQWRSWFAKNEASFRSTYLDDQFSDRTLRPQYVLIYGRHNEFDLSSGLHANPKELLALRAQIANSDERFMSFDSLRLSRDLADCLTLNMTASGPEVYRICRAASLGPLHRDDARRMRSVDKALERSADLTAERKEYLKKRWSFFREKADEEANGVAIYTAPAGFAD